MTKVICIGSSTKDIIFPINDGEIVETPEDLEAQKKIIFELGAKYQVSEGRHESIGGCAANVACGLARLGIKSYCCTRVGDDQSGDWIKKELEINGVEIGLVQTGLNHQSDLSAIINNIPSEDRIVFSDRDSNEKLEIIADEIKKIGAGIIFVSSLNGNSEEGWDKKLDKILDLLSQEKIKLIFNPGQKNIKSNPQKIIEVIRQTDILIINRDEATEIVNNLDGFNESSLNQENFLMEKLKKLGAQTVVLTDGERGAWAYDGERNVHVETSKIKVVDTIGAGDAFASAFLAAHIKGENIAECLKWGIINGGNVVQYYGGQEGLLGQEELEEKAKNVEVKEI
jgi:ribokinase